MKGNNIMKNIFSSIRKSQSAKFDPNRTNEEGHSYLHCYAAEGNSNGIDVFVIAGADVDRQDNHGMAPIHHAAFNGHLAAVRALFNAGANPNIRTKDGRSAAELALEGDHELVAAYIRKNLKHYP